MDSSIKVSIIVPVYNAEKYLKECLDSLVRQTLSDIEIIIIDDGSKDHSGSICEEYAAKDCRFHVIHKENEGLGYARNTGITAAKGEYIGFVDADDYVDQRMFEKLYRFASEHRADYVRCEHNLVDTGGKEIPREKYKLRTGYYSKDEMRRELLFPILGRKITEGKDAYIGVSVWRAIYKASIIKANGIRFMSKKQVYSEDIPFNFEFLVNADSAYVTDEILYNYVDRSNSLTNTYHEDRIDRDLYMYQYFCKRLKECGLPDECLIRSKNLMLDRMRLNIRSVLKLSGYALGKKYCTIRKMLNDPTFRTVFSEFPVNKMPLRYRLAAYMMKYRMTVVFMACANMI